MSFLFIDQFVSIRRWLLLPLALAGCWLAILATTQTAHAQALIGKFTVLHDAPAPKSLDVVVVEEFLNFSCPHCNNFREVAKPVFAKYGKRVKLVWVPVLFRGQIDAPLRLFYIAREQGKEQEIEQALFEASFKAGVNVFDPQVVGYLARTHGLQDAYSKDGNAEWVTQRIADGHARADNFGVEATPTLVLQGTLRMVPEATMQEFVANLDSVLSQLLK
jgi:protein dithiol oxidoreductase (disulfide-forming)